MFCTVVCLFIDIGCSCPATGMNESAEEDHPYTSQTRKPSASKSSLGRRHSVEVFPTHVLDHPYSFCRVVSRGDPQEVMNWGLGRCSRHSRSLLVFRLQREICFLCLSHSCRIDSLRVFTRVRDLILEVHLRTVHIRVPIGYDLKLLSDFVTHSSSYWSCYLQVVPILRRPCTVATMCSPLTQPFHTHTGTRSLSSI